MDKAGKQAVILSSLIYRDDNMKLKQQQSGFTLIELVVVIVILGILAATAIPKFVDLSEEASKAAAQGTAGAMSSALAINYASCAATGFDTTKTKCQPVTTCDGIDPEAFLQEKNFGEKYRIAVTDSVATGRGTTFACTLHDAKVEGGVSLAEFVGISTGV